MSHPSRDKALVLVVGAGASREIGLPMGSELKGLIAAALDVRSDRGGPPAHGSKRVRQALVALSEGRHGARQNLAQLQRACFKVRDALPQASSIDNFLDAHREDRDIALCGKLGIADTILEAEAHSRLWLPDDGGKRAPDFAALEGTWYNSFFRLLVDDCQLSGLSERLSKISIITFNYDRCIEQFLQLAVENYYGINVLEASSVLSHLSVVHAYGSLGSLQPVAGSRSVPYGGDADGADLLSVAGCLKTFTEGIEEESADLIDIHASLSGARKVAFLGLSYSRQNMQLLYGTGVGARDAQPPAVFGTAYGLSASDVELIRDELRNRCGYSGQLVIDASATCNALLLDFGRRLSIHL